MVEAVLTWKEVTDATVFKDLLESTATKVSDQRRTQVQLWRTYDHSFRYKWVFS